MPAQPRIGLAVGFGGPLAFAAELHSDELLRICLSQDDGQGFDVREAEGLGLLEYRNAARETDSHLVS
jgi:hypothetical protein